MASLLSAVLLCCMVMCVYSGALPRPRRIKLNQIRSGSYGGSPMTFKNSKDYYRKQSSNDPYRRKVVVMPLLDLTQGGSSQEQSVPQERASVELAKLFNKNGMFYLTAPGKPDRRGKPLLKKELDQDYVSLELLSNKRGYTTYANNGNRHLNKNAELSGLSELVSLVKSYGKSKPGGQTYSFHPIGFNSKPSKTQRTTVTSVREQYGPSNLELVEPKSKSLAGDITSVARQPFAESGVGDEDYRQEVLAVLKDVKQRGEALERQEFEKQDLEQPTEFRFEDLVS